MPQIREISYIGSELKPHHRLLMAVFIVMAIFLPVVIVTAFSSNINETTKISKKVATPKNVSSSPSLGASATKQPASEQVAPVVADPGINVGGVVSNYEVQDKSFGVSIVELDGKNRTGDYNGDDIFVSASTYKLFTAYSVLLRIENGSWAWLDSDIADGRDLIACFNDMVVYSDNDCAEALMYKISHQTVTDEARVMGCTDTTFIDSDGYARTTANDLALFLTKLYKGQILTQQSSRDILINAMKNNVYREGIPAGLSGDIVADKVGFIDGYLNDAAIVYDAKGDYVLVILTNNSSWTEIASIANEINLLRQ
jgi:beta-lactamase class A